MIVAAAVCVFIALASMQEASATPYAQHNIKDLVKDLNEIRSTTDPKAANMIKLEWSDHLAGLAQQKANSCDRNHEDGTCSYVMDDGEDIADSIDFWLDEVLNYRINHNDCKSSPSEPGFRCYYYRQMVWAESNAVGCAMKACGHISGSSKANGTLLVCKFSPGADKASRPFIVGNRCSKCPSDAPNCVNTKLCSA